MFFSRHKEGDLMKKGIRNAFGAFAYVALIVLFMLSIQRPDVPDSPLMGILAPIGMLMLFVLSAAVMGVLVFGSPVMLYLDGKKKEAMVLLGWTVGALAAITVCMLAAIAFVGGL